MPLRKPAANTLFQRQLAQPHNLTNAERCQVRRQTQFGEILLNLLHDHVRVRSPQVQEILGEFEDGLDLGLLLHALLKPVTLYKGYETGRD